MSFFKSTREKRLWFYAFLVLMAILSTLAIGRPLQEMLRDQNVQAVFFLIGMILTGVTIFMHSKKVQADKMELVVWFGLAALYIMFIFRLGAPERSHLMEYSVLAIFIHKALKERLSSKEYLMQPALFAFIATSFVGLLDECIQIFLPDRVFDFEDIQFNTLAAFMAIGGSFIIQWARKKFRKKG